MRSGQRRRRAGLNVLHGLLLGQAALLEAQHMLLLLALLLHPLLLGLLLLLRLLLGQLPAHPHGALCPQRCLIEAQAIGLAEQSRQLGRSAPVRSCEAALEEIATGLHVEQIAHALLQDAVDGHPELDPEGQHQLDAAATAAAVAGEPVAQVDPLTSARLLLVGRPVLQAEVFHLTDDIQSQADLELKRDLGLSFRSLNWGIYLRV